MLARLAVLARTETVGEWQFCGWDKRCCGVEVGAFVTKIIMNDAVG